MVMASESCYSPSSYRRGGSACSITSFKTADQFQLRESWLGYCFKEVEMFEIGTRDSETSREKHDHSVNGGLQENAQQRYFPCLS